jgi:hypothetical protein
MGKIWKFHVIENFKSNFSHNPKKFLIGLHTERCGRKQHDVTETFRLIFQGIFVIGNFSSASAWHQSTVMGVSHQTVR